MSDQHLRVPIGPGADRWVTVGGCRTVLGVARTVTSTVRLLDVLSLFRTDFRVQVVFAVSRSSPFGDGVGALLRSSGARLMPWDQAVETRFDLAVSASENAELERVDAPAVIFPHGVGFHKFVPTPEGQGSRLSGLVSVDLLRRGRVVLVVSHPAQEAQLRRVCPEVAGHTVVGGDPSFDRLLASVRLREHYRRVLGVRDGQRLVLLSSTWGGQSLLGRVPGLPARLLAELPADEYRVALVLHPNVWFGHGAWQVRTWLADASDAGLLLIPPTDGWQAALLGSDCVIGDHGSVTFYGAALGRPVLLAAFGDEVVPGTPMAELGGTAVRLDPRRGLRAQVDAALVGHDARLLTGLTAQALALPGQSERAVRGLLYDLLNLPPPANLPGAVAVADPRPEHRPVHSFVVHTRISDPLSVTLRRYPAAVATPESPGTVRHLAVEESERDRRLLESASVLVRRAATDRASAEAWAAETLTSYPGSRLAAAGTGDGCVVRLRDGRSVRVTAGGTDPVLLASAVYACLRGGRLADGSLLLRVGSAESTVALRLDQPG